MTAVLWNDNIDVNYRVAISISNSTTLAPLAVNLGLQERNIENAAIVGLKDKMVLGYREDDVFLSIVYQVRFTTIHNYWIYLEG